MIVIHKSFTIMSQLHRFSILFVLSISLLVFYSGCSCTPLPSPAARQPEKSPETNVTDQIKEVEAKSKDNPISKQLLPKKESQTTTYGTEEQQENTQPASDNSESGKESNPAPNNAANETYNKSPNLQQTSQRGKKNTVRLSPEEALAAAAELKKSAIALEAAGKTTAAFTTITNAWELVREHPKNEACRQFSVDITPDVRRLSDHAARLGREKFADDFDPQKIKIK